MEGHIIFQSVAEKQPDQVKITSNTIEIRELKKLIAAKQGHQDDLIIKDFDTQMELQDYQKIRTNSKVLIERKYKVQESNKYQSQDLKNLAKNGQLVQCKFCHKERKIINGKCVVCNRSQIIMPYTNPSLHINYHHNNQIHHIPVKKEELEEMCNDAKFFIIKSCNQDNIYIAKEYSKWATTINNQRKLNEAFNQAKNTMYFYGCARMESLAQPNQSFNEKPLWKNIDGIRLGGNFQIKWLRLGTLNFSIVSDLINPMTKDQVTKGRDCQEVPQQQGKHICMLFDHPIQQQQHYAPEEDKMKQQLKETQEKLLQQQQQQQIIQIKVQEDQKSNSVEKGNQLSESKDNEQVSNEQMQEEIEQEEEQQQNDNQGDDSFDYNDLVSDDEGQNKQQENNKKNEIINDQQKIQKYDNSEQLKQINNLVGVKEKQNQLEQKENINQQKERAVSKENIENIQRNQKRKRETSVENQSDFGSDDENQNQSNQDFKDSASINSQSQPRKIQKLSEEKSKSNSSVINNNENQQKQSVNQPKIQQQQQNNENQQSNQGQKLLNPQLMLNNPMFNPYFMYQTMMMPQFMNQMMFQNMYKNNMMHAGVQNHQNNIKKKEPVENDKQLQEEVEIEKSQRKKQKRDKSKEKKKKSKSKSRKREKSSDKQKKKKKYEQE